MELKEAIEILKETNDGFTFKACSICSKYNEKTSRCDKKKCDELIAIDTVLEELEKHKEHENQYMNAEIFSAKQLKAIEKDYIHKDKIREKIEERKKQLEETSKRREKAKEQEEQAVLWCIEIRLDERIKIYEELLKGE